MRYAMVLAAVLLVGAATDTLAGKSGGKLTGQAVIVRGVNSNSGKCTAKTIDSSTGSNDKVSQLSVSCDNEGKGKKGLKGADLAQDLRKGIDQAHACWTTLKMLQKKSSAVSVVRAPTRQNKHHCVVSGITPKQIAVVSKYLN